MCGPILMHSLLLAIRTLHVSMCACSCKQSKHFLHNHHSTVCNIQRGSQMAEDYHCSQAPIQLHPYPYLGVSQSQSVAVTYSIIKYIIMHWEAVLYSPNNLDFHSKLQRSISDLFMAQQQKVHMANRPKLF